MVAEDKAVLMLATVAIVPEAAGISRVGVPSAPVTGCNVMVPEVALPKITEPSVPEEPSDSAPALALALASLEQPDEPLLIKMLY